MAGVYVEVLRQGHGGHFLEGFFHHLPFVLLGDEMDYTIQIHIRIE